MSTIFRVSGIWQYSWFENGKRRKRSLSVRDRGIARLLKAQLDLDHAKRGAGLATDRDLEDFFEWYKKTHYVGLKASSIKEVRILRRFVSGVGADRLGQITTEGIHSWLFSQKIGPKTWNNIRGAIKTFLDAAVPKHIDKNPVFSVPVKKVPRHHVNFYTDEEYLSLESAAEKASCSLRDMIVLARYTGLRIGEILHLEGEDFVWEPKAFLYVKNKPNLGGWTVKNYQIRVIPLSGEVQGKLGHLRSKSGLLFPSPYGGPYKHFHEVGLNRILGGLGLKRKRQAWHLLRHTFASRAVQNGVPLPQVMQWLGHGDYKTTLRYAHLAPGYSSEIEKINLRTATESATAAS